MPSRYQGSEREKLSLEAFTVLTRAADALQTAAFRESPVPQQITMTQFEIMEALFHRGPLTHTQISSKILKTKGNISYMLAGLERSGFIRRVNAEGDRRARLIELTAGGRELIGSYFPQLAASFTRYSAALSTEELEELIELARRLGRGAAEGAVEKAADGRPEVSG